MVIETQWFVTRLARASQTPKAPVSPGRRGYVPAIWEAIDNRAGMWTGMVPVHAARLAITAVSYDTAVVDSATRSAEFGKLQALDDDRVFDMRDTLGQKASAWARDSSFQALLEGGLVDTTRFKNPTRSIRFHLRELARTLLFYQFLGRHFYPLPLDAKFADMALSAWMALGEHLEEFGFPAAKIPNRVATFKAFYRTALSEPSAGKAWHFGDGFHLGHPDAHLRGA